MKYPLTCLLILPSLLFAQAEEPERSVSAFLEESLEAYGPWSDIENLSYELEEEKLSPGQEWSYGAGVPNITRYRRWVDFARDRFRLESESSFPGGYLFEFVAASQDGQVLLWDKTGSRLGREYSDYTGTPFARQSADLKSDLGYFLVQSLLDQADQLRFHSEVQSEGRDQVVLRRQVEGQVDDYFFDRESRLLTQHRFLEVHGFREVAATHLYRKPLRSQGLAYASTIERFRGSQRYEVSRLRGLTPETLPKDLRFEPPSTYELKAEGRPPQVVEIAPDLYLIDKIAGDRNVLFVNLEQEIVVIGAPLGDRFSKAVLKLIRETVPQKPIGRVFVSHFHSDHSKGLRQYVHEGATLLMTEKTRPYVEQWVSKTPPKLKDDLSQSQRTPRFQTFSEILVVKDANHRIEFHPVKNSHAEGMAVAYFPKEKVLYQGDLLSLPEDGTLTPAVLTTREFSHYLKEKGLEFERMVGHHGHHHITPEMFRKVVSQAGDQSP